MATKSIGGRTVNVDEEGFMTDPAEWSKEVGEAIAKEEGIALTDRHWNVITFMQAETKKNGEPPTIRAMNKSGVVTTKELYELFPGGPAKKAAKIAGLKKPAGCV
ncbi:MAG: TusE/DsrC/DsvC family sulfur relay protein [Spirochaetota bacterium]